MSIDKVRNYLKKWHKDSEILELPISSATVADAAKALNCKEELIAKKMSFIIDETPILIVLAGDTKIDNTKFKKEFKTKAKMIPSQLLEELIGHEAGGVCPFGIKENVLVYLDKSLKRFPYIYPACGSSNSAIKLTIAQLEKFSNYKRWIDVAKAIN